MTGASAHTTRRFSVSAAAAWWSRLSRRWRWALQAIAALALLWCVLSLSTCDGKVNVAVDYLKQMQEMNPVGPEDERSWPLIRAAKQKSGEERLALLRQAAKRARLGIRIYPEPEAVDMVGGRPPAHALLQGSIVAAINYAHPNDLNDAGLDLATDLKAAAAAGDGQRAADDAEALIGLASQMATRGSTLYQQLTGVAQFTRSAEEIARGVSAHPDAFTDHDLARLSGTLAAIDHSRFRVDFAAERFVSADLLQRLYTDDGHGGGSLTLEASMAMITGDLWGPGRVIPQWLAAIVAPFHCTVAAPREEISQHFEPNWDAIQAEAGSLPWLIDRTDLSLNRFDRTPTSYIQRLRLEPFSTINMRHYFLYPNTCKKSETMVNAARLLVAAEQYRRANGRWPESIDELEDRVGGELPLDPWTGTPLHVGVVDGTFRVWSVGEDLTDEGGRPAQECVTSSGLIHVGSDGGGFFHKREGATESARPTQVSGGWIVIPNGKVPPPIRGDWVILPDAPPALSPSPDPMADSPAAAPSP